MVDTKRKRKGFLLLLNLTLSSLLPFVLGTNGAGSQNNFAISPDLANSWAEAILDTVFTSRHHDILNKLDSAATFHAVEAMWDNIVNENRLHGKPDSEIYEKFTPQQYISKLKESITNNKAINTIAIMIDEQKSSIYVAANIKNIKLPLDPSSPELYIRLANNAEVIFPHENFGLTDIDALDIKRAVQELNLPEFFNGKDPSVLVVEADYPKTGPLNEDLDRLKQQEFQTKADDAIEKHQTELVQKEAEMRRKGKLAYWENVRQSLERKLQNYLANLKKQIMEGSFGKNMDYRYELKKAHVYHAEMDLLVHIQKNTKDFSEKVTFGVTKSLCEKCQSGIETSIISGKPASQVIDYSQHEKLGLPADKVKNWDMPAEVKVTPLQEMEARAIATQAAPTWLDTSSCTRRKRSVASPCGKVKAKDFVQQYIQGDAKARSKLGDFAYEETAKVHGLPEDILKVQAIGKLERLKDYNRVTLSTKIEQKFNKVWDDVTANFEKFQTRVSQSALAKRISTFTASRGFNAFSKTSSSVGYFLLGKSVIQGFVQKDYTSLAIVGSRLALDGIGYVGRVASFGAKFGKTAGIIGKAAGPIGLAMDAGLSIYSLTKSIERLQSANNEFDRKDAIADIVQSSADLLITATVVAFSAAFPPVAVVGLIVSAVVQFGTALFKTGNEIDRINSEIPLLDFEKSEQFTARFFDWFGTRQNDYIDDLLEVKKYNEMAVKQGIDILKENPQFTGMAFPARSISYSGTCAATRRSCSLKNAWGCTASWGPDEVLANGCDHGEKCDSYECTNFWTSTGFWTYDDYRCLCDSNKSPKVDVGYPRLNNFVDLRSKRELYLERAVPGNVDGAQYKCRPGHASYQGFRISQKSTSHDHLCEGTIAIYQPRRTKETVNGTFYFDLEEGDDTVYLDPTSAEGNTFLIQNGFKKFTGSKGPDTFIIHENCTSVHGILNGGPLGEDNRIIMSDKFLAKETIFFENGCLYDSQKKLDLRTMNINEIIGRAEAVEVLNVDCETGLVRLQGGERKGNPDRIYIDHKASCPNGRLTVVAEGSTLINASIVNLQIVAMPRPDAQLTAELELDNMTQVTVLVQHGSANISSFNVTKIDDSSLMLGWKAAKNMGDFTFNFSYKQNGSLEKFFAENTKFLYFEGNHGSSSYSFLRFENDLPLLYHTLDNNPLLNATRIGSADFTNIYFLRGGKWTVYCGLGKFVDKLVLSSKFAEDGGSIHCSSSNNVLVLDENERNKHPVKIDLKSKILGDSGVLMGISVVQGRKKAHETVIVACETEYVSTLGGVEESPDVVILSNLESCASSRNTSVIVQGHTLLKLEDGNHTSTTISLLAFKEQTIERLNLTVKMTWNSKPTFLLFLSELHLQQDNSSAKSTKLTSKNGDILDFNINNSSRRDYHGKDSSAVTLTVYNNASEYNGILVLNPNTEAIMIHSLPPTNSSCKQYYGVSGIPNYFRVSGACWTVKGGNGSLNYFLLNVEDNEADLWNLSIRGGPESENTLIVDALLNKSQNLTVNFLNGWIGHHFGKSGKFSNIQHLLGRLGAPDIISLAYDSGLLVVNGRGGAGAGLEDVIYIDNPPSTVKGNGTFRNPLLISVPRYTKVQNTAAKGYYIYDISLESGLDCVKFLPNAVNHHELRFRFIPSQGFLTGVNLDEKASTLTLLFGFNASLSYKAVKVEESDGSIRLNPSVNFVSLEEDVSCRIKLGQISGSLEAQWDITGTKSFANNNSISLLTGLDVSLNVFVVNVSDSSSSVSIQGGQQDNQVWLVSSSYATNLSGSMDTFTTNSLHIMDSYFTSLTLLVDLSDIGGSVTLTNGTVVIENLLNFNNYYGRSLNNDTVIPGCNTALISHARKIVIRPGQCNLFDLDILLSLEQETEVEFQFLVNEENDTLYITEPKGLFRYHFQRPSSFTPTIVSHKVHGSQLRYSSHLYHLSFTLSDLLIIDFYPWNHTLRYDLVNGRYFHGMLTELDDANEFYPQPRLLLRCGCEIKVGRNGDVVAVCEAKSNNETSILSMGKRMADFANRLGITILYRTNSFFVHVGHNLFDERNLLTTTRNLTNYLNGGGGKDAIYEVAYLEQDVYIDPGFWLRKSNLSDYTHTIDLTSVMAPIRNKTRTKYLLVVKASGEDLIFSLPEHIDKFPGKVFILNGTRYSGILQVLLSSAIMEINEGFSANLKEETVWTLSPKPVLIEKGSVHSISQSDLEDDHQLIYHNGNDTESDNNTNNFRLVKSDDDLIITDLTDKTKDPTVVVLLDFYPEIGEFEFARNIHINFPGLDTVLESSIQNKVYKASAEISWDELLEQVEGKLLEGMPDIPRSFRIQNGSNIFPYLVMTIVMIIGIFSPVVFTIIYRERLCLKGYIDMRRFVENAEAVPELETTPLVSPSSRAWPNYTGA